MYSPKNRSVVAQKTADSRQLKNILLDNGILPHPSVPLQKTKQMDEEKANGKLFSGYNLENLRR